MIKIKRVYEAPSASDGRRILVDRLWPRGLKKDQLAAEWLKDVSPSTELRQWFGHDPAKWEQFMARYAHELATNPAFEQLKAIARSEPIVTLLYAASDPQHNQAIVLMQLLESGPSSSD